MKHTLKYLLIAISLLAACKADFGNLNDDPTKVSSAPTKNLLTNAIQRVPFTTLGYIDTLTYEQNGNYYVQYVSEGPYPGAANYTTLNQPWDAFYYRPLANLQAIIDYNTADNPLADPSVNGSKNNQLAVARILRAFYFWTLTDKYGDIPYSEALKGIENISPKYDKQQDIYYDLFKELKEASQQISETEAGVSGDILLHGNMTEWKKFANTTRLFMALRLVKNDYDKGKAEFTDAVSSGILSGNLENVIYHFLNDPKNYNPWYNNYSVNQRNDYAISATLTDYMGQLNDPRLPLYGEVLADGTVKGLPYGQAAQSITGAFSRLGDDFRAANSPAYIYTYAQVLFALAEGAKVGYLPGGDATAEEHYRNAIKSSFEMYGVFDEAAYQTYISLPEIAYSPAEGIKKIIYQKWIHQYLNGFEAWSDWRRTGFPVLKPAEEGVVDYIPRRMGYPTDEATINTKNYQEAVARQGPDELGTRMWWDK
ncbi:SusD/RagB family nutrient-binding outer membrane lipoprotein [Pedobacter sp. HMF7647]|uniref:SusD/RagB family nutrient-binding outer membrane lipoprotein n=1 Tax=Hufsiella arboris TaxID=2695275 RepID=A0A7K1YE54_9SPHI|nr:SusD/RagB family nutrient-binding outer membrane lipoprotein [Hufsiella arboris]MXV52894.1 SusD/RagB family nutrient-binding outer membrane lipoprotein [Hufsiella arboris]